MLGFKFVGIAPEKVLSALRYLKFVAYSGTTNAPESDCKF